jgi:hypothetical protein
MAYKKSYQSSIAELHDALEGFKEKLAAYSDESASVVECIECMVIAEDLLNELYYTYFSSQQSFEEDKAATVLFELARNELITPYLVEEYMEAQRAVILFRVAENLKEHTLYQEYLSKIPIFCAMLQALVPVVERLPKGLERSYEERDDDEEHL